MKKFKKLAIAMPLAGMVMSGAGILGGNAAAHADTIKPTEQIQQLNQTIPDLSGVTVKAEVKQGFVDEDGAKHFYGDGSDVYKFTGGPDDKVQVPLEKGQLLVGRGDYLIHGNTYSLNGSSVGQ